MAYGKNLIKQWGYDLSKPNIKKMFVPDAGKVIIDIDLEQADAQVVAWESGCQRLKDIFNDPNKDLHDENTRIIYGYTRADIEKGTLTKQQFEKDYRFKTKGGVHGTNYRGGPGAIAAALGVSIQEAEEFQRVWFEANPEILEWHERTEEEIITRGYLENKFGFRRQFLGRVDKNTLNEAQAWVPQSTVGHVINKGWQRIESNINQRVLRGAEYWRPKARQFVEVLMQVHDSLVMQVDKSDLKSLLPDIRECMLVEIPYDDPLTIGVGNPEISEKSYGEVKPHTWEGEPL